MSASLVGSEMCIRDRAAAALAAAMTRATMHSRKSGVSIAERVLHCGTPVSYTHLTLPTICSV
eukprot:8196077-Alexandrium_andersonii.AAC.1